jgi:hypothetical protein
MAELVDQRTSLLHNVVDEMDGETGSNALLQVDNDKGSIGSSVVTVMTDPLARSWGWLGE